LLWILKPELKQYFSIYITCLVFYWSLAYVSFFLKILTWWKIYTLNYILGIVAIFGIFGIYTYWTQSLLSFTQCFVIIGWISALISWVVFIYYWKYKN
jgi:hypothetical protein